MSAEEYPIKEATLEDAEDIYQLEQKTNPHPWQFLDLCAGIERHQCRVITRDDAIVAFLLFQAGPDFSEILLLATAPHLRHQHLATALIKNLVQYNEARAIPKILLEVRKENSAAQRFYAKCGFRKIGQRKNYYRHPVDDALILEKECRKKP